MEALAVALVPCLLGVGLWTAWVRPRLGRVDLSADGPAPREETPLLLGAFVAAWLANGILLMLLAGLLPGADGADGPPPPAAEHPADTLATSTPSADGPPAADPTAEDADTATLVDQHGLSTVLGLQSTANLAAVLLLLAMVATRRPALARLGFRRAGGPAVSAGLAGWLGFMPVLALAIALNTGFLTWLTGQAAPGQAYLDAFQESSSAAGELLVWAAIVVIIPVAEEVLYRGGLLAALRPVVGTGGAVMFSSLAFGLQHDTVVILPTAALGALLAWLRLRTGSLAAPIVAHVLQNGYTLGMATLLAEHSS